jgi:hypothetical protein
LPVRDKLGHGIINLGNSEDSAYIFLCALPLVTGTSQSHTLKNSAHHYVHRFGDGEKDMKKETCYSIFAEMNNQETLKFNNFVIMGVWENLLLFLFAGFLQEI